MCEIIVQSVNQILTPNFPEGTRMWRGWEQGYKNFVLYFIDLSLSRGYGQSSKKPTRSCCQKVQKSSHQNRPYRESTKLKLLEIWPYLQIYIAHMMGHLTFICGASWCRDCEVSETADGKYKEGKIKSRIHGCGGLHLGKQDLEKIF